MAAGLAEIAQKMVAPGKGILAADESNAHHHQALREARHRLDRGQPARLSRDALPRQRGDVELRLRRHPLRRDDPPEGQGRHAAGRGDQGERRDARHQGRHRRQAARPVSPARRSPRASTASRERLKEYYELGARFAKWRAVINIGPGMPEPQRHQRQRPCARPLRRALPGGGHRPDRRAGGADGRAGRDPRHRHLLRGHRVDAEDRVRASSTSPTSSSTAWC